MNKLGHTARWALGGVLLAGVRLESTRSSAVITLILAAWAG